MLRMKRKEKNKKNQSINQSYLKHPLREIYFGVFIVSAVSVSLYIRSRRKCLQQFTGSNIAARAMNAPADVLWEI